MNRQQMVFATSIAAGMFALMPISSAHASYQGLQVQLHTVVNAGGGPRFVYRVYAAFSDAGDFLTSVSGTPMIVQSLDASGLFPGGDFYDAPTGAPNLTWTHAAIGDFIVPDAPGFIVGNQFNANANWFTPGPAAQGMAGNGVSLGGGLWGVLTMQLTVNAGNHVRGTIAIGGVNNSPLAGGTTFQTMADQTFNSFPGPGSLTTVVLAGVMSRRRRVS
jgi:hypothetical protein